MPLPPDVAAKMKAADDAVAIHGDGKRHGGPRKGVPASKKRADQMRVAALVGAGKGNREIAAELKLSKTAVATVREKMRKGTDTRLVKAEVLNRQAERARRQLGDEALHGTLEAVRLMRSQMEDGQEVVGKDSEGASLVLKVKPGLRDVAVAGKVMGELVGMAAQGMGSEPAGQKEAAKLTGAVMAELLLALRAHEQQKQLPKEVRGERVD